jgi:hypothetical protein
MKKLFNDSILIYGVLLALLMTLSLCGCVASSSYYSARTLDQNKFALGFGADDIILKESKNLSGSVGISKDLPFAPSIGFAYGLPLNLETGLRWYPARFLEASLREQVNPKSFDLFDGSIDFSYAGLLGGYSYIKYGATISKNIDNFEPFVHYSFYQMTGHMTGVTSGSLDGFISNLTSDLINNSRTLGFGIGLPFHKVKFFPEVDYQYYGNNLPDGLWHFGIGLRIYTN